MTIDLYDSNGSLITKIDKVLTCQTEKNLDGVNTLNFEVLIDDALKNVKDDKSYFVEFNNDTFDVISISRSLSGGLFKIKFQCEHISYRLSNISKKSFYMKAQVKDILSKILENTDFKAGFVDIDIEYKFSVKSESTIKSILLTLASELKCDIEFKGIYVSLFLHKGSSRPLEIIDNNVVSISKTVKKGTDEPSYSLTLRDVSNLILGDELHLKFEKLGIDENVRLLGIKAKPFVSKNYDLTVGSAEQTIEEDLVSMKGEAVIKEKSTYGVKISEVTGLTIEREDKKGKVIMNADEFKMQTADSAGVYSNALFFDPQEGEYKFKGNVNVKGGSINVNDKFIVDPDGTVYIKGESTIYGGKYYAQSSSTLEGYSQMTPTGYEVYNNKEDLKLRLGYTAGDEDYPFLQLGSGTGKFADFGLVKKFTDGLWIGNSAVENASGQFAAMKGYNGIFFRFSDNTAYVVKDTIMENIYTGEAIAKFG